MLMVFRVFRIGFMMTSVADVKSRWLVHGFLGFTSTQSAMLGKQQRIQDTKHALNRMSLLWKDPTTNMTSQLLMYDAVIKTKLLDSLERIHLTQSLRARVDAFHFAGSTTNFKVANYTI